MNSADAHAFSAGAGRRSVEVNGVQMGVVVSGRPQEEEGRERTTLVLLHGFTGSAEGWGELLERLALPTMQVIALDMLGHGQSSAPPNPERYSMEHCRADILAALQALGIEQGQALLLGYSMGGRIALFTALTGFFRALILESASPGLSDAHEREQRRRSDDALAASIEQDGVPAFVERWGQLPLFTSQKSLSPERREALQAQRLQNRAEGLANSLRGVGTGVQPALHEQLRTLALPTLLIAGQLDTKFCAIAQQMAEQLPHAQVHIVPNAGHTVHLEQPDTFVATVKTFCMDLLQYER